MDLRQKGIGQMLLVVDVDDPSRPEKNLWGSVLIGAIEEALGGGVRPFPREDPFDSNMTKTARQWLLGKIKIEGVDVFQVLEWLDLEYNSVVPPVLNAIKNNLGLEILDRLSPQGRWCRKHVNKQRRSI